MPYRHMPVPSPCRPLWNQSRSTARWPAQSPIPTAKPAS